MKGEMLSVGQQTHVGAAVNGKESRRNGGGIGKRSAESNVHMPTGIGSDRSLSRDIGRYSDVGHGDGRRQSFDGGRQLREAQALYAAIEDVARNTIGMQNPQPPIAAASQQTHA